MNSLDIIILLPIVFGLIRGLIKGLVNELTSIVAIVCGVIAAKLYAVQLTGYLLKLVQLDPSAAKLLAYFLIFLTVVLTLSLIGKLFSKLISSLNMGGLNKMLGAIFGAVKYALIVSVILNASAFFETKIPFLKPEAKSKSALYIPVKEIAAVAWQQLP